MQAIRVMGDQRGFDIAQRRITVSTAGHVEGLLKLAALSLPRIRVAVSINAAEDSLRDSIMPINKKYPLGILKEALAALPLGKDSVIFIEYVLLAGINDSPELADTLADYLQGLRVRVNVIAYNQCGSLPFKTPSPLCVRLFCNRLVAKKLFVRIRQSRGFGIEAACGQLSAALPAPLP
jgi:23S rRNA (adenine2503-C2)-methyltransferase